MIDVKLIEPRIWKTMAADAHLSVFKEQWDAELETIDFAMLMVLQSSDTAVSYATVQEMDDKSVYLQYGGVFPDFKGTMISYRSFHQMIERLKQDYKKITTFVENTNYSMLKFYMKENFKITGIRFFGDLTLLENNYESDH